MTGGRIDLQDLVRVWSSAVSAGRQRRPTDAILLGAAVVLLVVVGRVAPGPGELDTGIAAFAGTLPELFGLLWGLGYTLLTGWAVVLLVLPLLFVGRRQLSLVLALSGLVALAGGLVAGSAAGVPREQLWQSLVGPPDGPVYPAVRVAVATAIVVTASPWLARPLRHLGRAAIVLGGAGAAGLLIAWASGALAGFVLGVAAAAVTRLLLGTPQGLLTATQVEVGLGDIGVRVRDVRPLPAGIGGEQMWQAATDDGTTLRVRALGRDEWDSQLVGSLWAALTRRGEAVRWGRSRAFRVEHEALATVMARQAGVPVLDVVAVGRSAQADALLATTAATWSLADVVPVPAGDVDESAAPSVEVVVPAGGAPVSDADLDAAWDALATLHRVGMAHGRMGTRAVVRREDDTVALADFADADLTADDSDRQVDRVRLLVATALAAGRERALARAAARLGTDGVIELLPYLQPAVVGRHERTLVRAAGWSVRDLQQDAVTLVAVDPPALQQIRRVSVRSVAIVAIIALAAYTLISAISGVDLQAVGSALASASWAWVVLAIACSPLIQVCFAFSTLGSTLRRLRYVPVLMLQYAIAFIALCLPSTAARLALSVRFFERFGLPAATAIGIGMIDSFSGFLVQIALVVVIVVTGLPGFTTSLRSGADAGITPSTSDPGPIMLVAVFILVGLVVTFAVPRLRHRLLGSVPRIKARVATHRRNAGDALQVVRHPRKVATMLAGNLAAQVVQAVMLGICLAAFGETAHLSQLILINTAVSLFAGLMPVPGGMGVAEAGYTAGLQAIGVPAADALSVAIVFRLATFYLPPLWGSVAMRWLRRHDYV